MRYFRASAPAMILIAVLLVGGSLAGWALEVAHPAFFAREPVVLWTAAPSPPPTLLFCGRPWLAEWRMAQESGRVRWEARLEHAPLGVWLVCVGSECFAFLRVDESLSLVEIVGAPPKTQVSLGNALPLLVVSEQGKNFFVVPPGRYTLVAEYACDRVAQDLALSPGERRILRFGELLEVGSSAAEILPGHRLRVMVRVRSVLSLPYLGIQVSLPPGWRITEEELFLPVPAGRVVARAFTVEVPVHAEEGVYTLSVRWHKDEHSLHIPVRKLLSPWVVVGHWDVHQNRLDLTAPYDLTFERVLWAASLLGRPIPYTAEVMTPELLHAILEAWASGAGG
ncbi:MAG: hypothetical protein ABDI20_05650 [Candidatus Bipolaricaulaceae bacterium]